MTAKPLRGHITVATDKSLSHRALIFAALADGASVIEEILTGEDVLRTLKILNELGVKTEPSADAVFARQEFYAQHPLQVVVHGVGLRGLKAPRAPLYCGNSGTTLRLMLGLLSAQNFESRLTGDASLNARPVDRVLMPLGLTGARFEIEHHGAQRFVICKPRDAAHPVLPITYDSPIASAQIKTCLLLSGLYADGETVLSEPTLSRDHTEILLAHQGVDVGVTRETKPVVIRLKPGRKLQPLHFRVPGDISSAAFFLVAASIVPNSEVTITGVNVNPTRTGILDVLRQMGANLSLQNERTSCGEKVADITVKSAPLQNVTIEKDLIPRLIDEIPILALAGLCASGTMIVRDAKELRVKETDRIAAIALNLQKLGADIQPTPDGFVLPGQGTARLQNKMAGAAHVWQTFSDHRIAMMGEIANLIVDKPFLIDDAECIRTSFPGFFGCLGKI